jgi:hypothetical protein
MLGMIFCWLRVPRNPGIGSLKLVIFIDSGERPRLPM